MAENFELNFYTPTVRLYTRKIREFYLFIF